MNDPLSLALVALEGIGVLAFALSGILAGARKQLDVVGVAVIAFLTAFGNKDTTIKKLRAGASNKSYLGGIFQTNNINA